MYLRNYMGSDVGGLTLKAGKYASLLEHLVVTYKGKKMLLKYAGDEPIATIVVWTNIIGKEIDRAKTEEKFEVPAWLLKKIKNFNPDWSKYAQLCKRDKNYSANFDDLENDKIPPVKSNCPLGKYARYLRSEYKLFTGNKQKTMDILTKKVNTADERAFLDMLAAHVCVDRLPEMMQAAEELYKQYTASVKEIMDRYSSTSKVDSERAHDQRSSDFDICLANYRDTFEAIVKANEFIPQDFAYALLSTPNRIERARIGRTYYIGEFEDRVQHVYTKDDKLSKSCAFKVCYKYILDLLNASSDNMINVKIPDTFDGEVITVKEGKTVINGRKYNKIKLSDGEYTVFNNSKGSFVKAGFKGERKSTYDILNTNNENLVKLQPRDKQEFNKMEEILKDSERQEAQTYMTICGTKNYCLDLPGKVICNVLDKGEFTVGLETKEVDGEMRNFPVMLLNIKGVMTPVAGFNHMTLDMVGKKFTVNEMLMELNMINFFNKKATKTGRTYNNGKPVKEAVSFVATYIGEDATIINKYTDSIKFESNYDITEENREKEETHMAVVSDDNYIADDIDVDYNDYEDMEDMYNYDDMEEDYNYNDMDMDYDDSYIADEY